MSVNFSQRLFAHIAGGDGQEPAGEYFSEVRDENKSLSVVNPALGASNSVRCTCPEHRRKRMAVAFPFFLRATLQQEAAIVLCLRALDIKFHAARGLVELFKDLLELLC